MKFKFIVLAAILAVGTVFQAQATTITFTGVNTSGDTLVATGDFNFDAPNFSSSFSQGFFRSIDALNSLVFAVDGETINVPSITNIVVNSPRGGGNGLITFSGVFPDTAVLGGTVNFFSFRLSGLNFPFTNTSDLGASLTELANDNLATTSGSFNFLFSQINTSTTRSGFFELTDVSLSSVSAVPIPAALPLLATAIAFIGLIGRRRRAI